jgi:hypothetical protein
VRACFLLISAFSARAAVIWDLVRALAALAIVLGLGFGTIETVGMCEVPSVTSGRI